MIHVLMHWNQRCLFSVKIWVPVSFPTTGLLIFFWHQGMWIFLGPLACQSVRLWSMIQAGLSSLATAAAGRDLREWWGAMWSNWQVWLFLSVYFWNIIFGMTNDYDVNLTSSPKWSSFLHTFLCWRLTCDLVMSQLVGWMVGVSAYIFLGISGHLIRGDFRLESGRFITWCCLDFLGFGFQVIEVILMKSLFGL